MREVVGVEDLGVDLEGVDDLEEAGVGLGADAAGLEVEETVDLEVESDGLAEEREGLDEDRVALEVGVAGLEGFDVEVNVGRPVGVAGLDPPDDEGLRTVAAEEFNPGEHTCCLDDIKLLLEAGSDCEFAN